MKDRLNRVRRKNNSIFILCRGALRSLNFLLSCAEVEKLLIPVTFNIMLTLIV
uniref:Bm344 n=1 Tax=Brugia malayi TaxID=6279 RepID=A0A1U7F0G2_BRUMA|nr:Bm344 [Brugia malayi]CDP99281.1 Bm623 [Brugia malayi]